MGDVDYAGAVAICVGVRFCVGAGSGKKLTRTDVGWEIFWTS